MTENSAGERTVAPPIAAPAGRASGAAALVNPAEAHQRIQRTLFGASGLAGLVFGLLHITKIIDQWSELAPVYAAVAAFFGVVAPLSLIVVSRVPRLRVSVVFGAAIAIGFFVVHALWPVAQTVPTIAEVPWMQGVNTIPALIAALVWSRRWAWLYVGLQLPLVAVTEYLATDGYVRDALLSGVLSVLFSGIVVGVSIALLDAADRQDAAAAKARESASREATARTRQREQARIDSIMLEEVMSALSLAGREAHAPHVVGIARRALDKISELTAGKSQRPDYTPEAMLSALRGAATDADPEVEFWHRNDATVPYSAEIVEALSEALSEAVRNSVRHAGAPGEYVSRVVNATLVNGAVRVVIQDSGRGFNLRTIPQRALGIRVSIIERMASLPGGSARIDSRPGRGATVQLDWGRGQ